MQTKEMIISILIGAQFEMHMINEFELMKFIVVQVVCGFIVLHGVNGSSRFKYA